MVSEFYGWIIETSEEGSIELIWVDECDSEVVEDDACVDGSFGWNKFSDRCSDFCNCLAWNIVNKH